MDDLVSSLVYPLLILVIGAVLSGWLIPKVTQRWQDERKAQEIKADLVERVARAVTEITTATQFAIVKANSQTMADFDESYRAWMLDKAMLTSLLNAYFRAGGVSDSWLRCRALATAYYVQSGVQRPEPESAELARQSYLGAVSAGLSSEPPEDRSDDPLGFSRALTESLWGADLSDARVLRSELDMALMKCVMAIVDEPISLARSSRS